MGNGTGEQGHGSGKSALFDVLQRSLRIGRAEGDTIRTGAWEAGWSGAQQSAKVQQLAERFAKMVKLGALLEAQIEQLPPPLVADLQLRLQQIGKATDELQSRVVGNNDTERDRFLNDTEAQKQRLKELAQDAAMASQRAAARPPPTITWQHPALLRPGVPITLELLGARTDSTGTLKLLHRDREVTAAVLQVGDGQPLVLQVSETAQYRASSLPIKVNVRAVPRVITWQPPQAIEWGTPLTLASLRASATGEGELVLDDAALASVGPDRPLTLTAVGSASWQKATATAKVNVTLASRGITWSPPATVVFGAELAIGALTAKATAGTGALRITQPPGGRFAAAGPGQRLEVVLAATGFHVGVTMATTVDVTKVVPRITWREPASVVVGTKLTGTQLDAVVEPHWVGVPEYEPRANTEMTATGTIWLRATLSTTRNAEAATKDVRLAVHANAKTKQGYERMRDGSMWKRPANGPAADVAKNWDDDAAGMRTQGKQLMTDLQAMTAEELVLHLDALVPPEDKQSQGGTYPNEMWKFANGLQVRYKRNGSQFHPGVPMFCMEGRTTPGFSMSQATVAFKLTADGAPAAKGPSADDTRVPNDVHGEIDMADYRSGTCDATHLRCRAKQDQVIDWDDPAPIVVGTPLSATQLGASLRRGDGVLTYETARGTPLDIGNRLPAGLGQRIRVRATATPRYNATTKVVQIDVQRAK